MIEHDADHGATSPPAAAGPSRFHRRAFPVAPITARRRSKAFILVPRRRCRLQQPQAQASKWQRSSCQRSPSFREYRRRVRWPPRRNVCGALIPVSLYAAKARRPHARLYRDWHPASRVSSHDSELHTPVHPRIREAPAAQPRSHQCMACRRLPKALLLPAFHPPSGHIRSRSMAMPRLIRSLRRCAGRCPPALPFATRLYSSLSEEPSSLYLEANSNHISSGRISLPYRHFGISSARTSSPLVPCSRLASKPHAGDGHCTGQ